MKAKNLLVENVKKEYALILGQCSPKLISKIKWSDKYPAADLAQDVVQLLMIIRGYCCQFNNHQQSTWALENAKHHVSIFYQGVKMMTLEMV